MEEKNTKNVQSEIDFWSKLSVQLDKSKITKQKKKKKTKTQIYDMF